MTTSKTKLFLASLLLIFVGSCDFTGERPGKIFNTIALNANKIPRSFEYQFRDMMIRKEDNSLIVVDPQTNEMKKASCVEYVAFHYAIMFNSDLDNIKKLKATDETQPIIDAGLELFTFADEIYKNDFPRIAKMIDEGMPEEEIKAAVEELDNTKGIELDEKYGEMMDLMIPYADKHGVKYEFVDMGGKSRD
ncbi:MAG: hypothetical protein LBE91_09200 [Tannerella sp.]|jgi:hypothetical protein|nr:hypothetical protein [Tannerella sp.]